MLTLLFSYWDNVAGPTLDAALLNFKHDGLIIVRTSCRL